ncbi:hypothetical protein ACI65C_009990 [Semiaphis heraclei]
MDATIYNSYSTDLNVSLVVQNLDTTEDIDLFNQLIEFYSPVIDTLVALTELKMFRNKLASQNITQKSAFDALLKRNEDVYPNIHFVFKVLCTLPVFTATSSLKRIKSYLLNTISEKRLNGLAMLSIHRDILTLM